jgi:oligopeptide/dipeptide ABC transporter ATP-binding protein
MSAVLELDDYGADYPRLQGAVDGVSFVLNAGERLGIVGESGSGKSTMVMGLLGLLPDVTLRGSASFDGRDLVRVGESEIRTIRGSDIVLIPQSAMSALNPVMRVGAFLSDVLRSHFPRASRKATLDRSLDALARVGLAPDIAQRFPHELSGGMLQRVCVAVALMMKPRLIIADEPTSALDVITQRTVMRALVRAQESIGAAMILIGHDLALQAQVSHRLGIMYAGRLVEIAPTGELLDRPHHPYTQALVASIPRLSQEQTFTPTPAPPPARRPAVGCVYQDRCPHAMRVCETTAPVRLPVARGDRLAQVACHLMEVS